MTEEQIESMVERKFDQLDTRLLDGRIDQAAYDAEARAIHDWAEAQYRAREVANPQEHA